MISKATQHGLENDYFDAPASLVPKPMRTFTWHYPKEYPKPLTTPLTIEKALYGLKTAPRLWNKTINAFFSLEFKQSKADPDLYIHDKGNANMRREKGDTI